MTLSDVSSVQSLRSQNASILFDGDEDKVYYSVITAIARDGLESEPSNQVQAFRRAKPVFSLDFEDEPLGQYKLLSHKDTESLEVRQDAATNTRYLSATYVPSEIGSPRLVFSRKIPPSDEYTLSYQLLFEDGFDFAKGGKLPGLAPHFPSAGCEMRDPASWSVRLMWMQNGRVSLYYYDQQPVDNCGTTVVGQNFWFTTGRWYDLSIYVKLNTDGQENGEIALYVDGAKIVSRNNVQLRGIDNDDSKIQQLLFSTFFGGGSPEWSPSAIVSSRFDQFEVHQGFRVRALMDR